jgi:hypothetical protein
MKKWLSSENREGMNLKKMDFRSTSGPLHPLDSFIYSANGETVSHTTLGCEHKQIVV